LHFRKADWDIRYGPTALLIVDPINPTNNIGSNTFNMYKVKAALESAYNTLVSTFDSGYSHSLLGRILVLTKNYEEMVVKPAATTSTPCFGMSGGGSSSSPSNLRLPTSAAMAEDELDDDFDPAEDDNMPSYSSAYPAMPRPPTVFQRHTIPYAGAAATTTKSTTTTTTTTTTATSSSQVA